LPLTNGENYIMVAVAERFTVADSVRSRFEFNHENKVHRLVAILCGRIAKTPEAGANHGLNAGAKSGTPSGVVRADHFGVGPSLREGPCLAGTRL
jgi:hypothetical protein